MAGGVLPGTWRQPREIPLTIRERYQLLRARLRRGSMDAPAWWPRWRVSALVILGVGLALVWTTNVWLVTCGFAGCPTSSEIRAFHPSEGGRILDRDGKLIGRLAIVRRVNVPLSRVPRHVQRAFIATEDRRFFDHDGLDGRAFGRAIVRNVLNLGVREGFSTITMQVAHNSFLQGRYNGRSFRRKMVELRISRLLERELTKDQILEHYLNVIYLGNGVNGVEAASRDLFGKSIDKVTVAEGAMLAALPKAPSSYTPRRSRPRALARRNLVLGLMEQQGYLSASEASAARRVPLRVAAEEWRPSIADEPSVVDAIRAFVDSVTPDVLRDGDVTVHTTIDGPLQRAADRHVIRQAAAITRETRASYGRVAEAAQGSYVALDPFTGDVRALVTGRRTQRGGFNRAMRARRQPGSAFKPFVYAAALEGQYPSSQLVDDNPVEVVRGRDVWVPANYDGEYQGTVTFHRALLTSANAATVRVSQTVGPETVAMRAHRSGINSKLTPVPSIALGALEVTPMELVAAYAPFVNGGGRVTPRLVTRIEAPDGTTLHAVEATPPTEGVLDPRIGYEMTTILRAVVDHGTGRAIREAGITTPIAGKTGTTNDGSDVWFVGYSPTLVAGIWFGYDTPRPISRNAAGGRLAAPAWAQIYRTGWKESVARFPLPAQGEGMEDAVIDPETGQLATEWCPRRVREWYRAGKTPREPCSQHYWEPQVIAEEHGDAERSRGTPRRGNDIERAIEGLRKRLGRIFRP